MRYLGRELPGRDTQNACKGEERTVSVVSVKIDVFADVKESHKNCV